MASSMDPNLLRAALDALDVGIALVGPDHRIRHCNSAYADLLAAPPEFLLGASLFGAGSPCKRLADYEAEWDRGETLSVTGESQDGAVVDILVRPLAPGSDVRLILARRAGGRSIQSGTLPADVLADLRSFIGDLTGHAAADATLARAPLSILVLAVDGLENARRTGGNAAAEEVIRQVTQVLVLEKRKQDIISRYGDGLFLVLAPDTPGHQAALLAERLRDRVDAVEIDPADDSLRPHLRVSTAEYRPHLDGSVREAVDRAASALWTATASREPDVDTTAKDR
ncbi:MAG TPA: diguanylate cyclase [Gemmatimonadota bacterium]|nr:diguanylate cyclase [Gemmatimonadota bacterium]